MIRSFTNDNLISLVDLNKSLLASASSFNMQHPSFILDYRKELVILLQNWESILKKGLMRDGAISRVDEEFYSHDLEFVPNFQKFFFRFTLLNIFTE